MTTAREEILGRVRAALADVEPDPDPVPMVSAANVSDRAAVVALFAERVADYGAVVERCSAADLEQTVTAALPAGATVVVPRGLSVIVPEAMVDEGLTAAQLDHVDVVVTEARVGIAETGTIVLDHSAGQGRRAITLVPDRHVCIVRADDVLADVPDAVRVLDPVRPLTWISGPSATSDIELNRVEGVHGPRHLHVLIVDQPLQ